MDTVAGLSIVLSSASVIAAALAAWFTGSQAVAASQQARAADEQLRLAERVRRDQAQPYVFADLRPDEREPMLVMLLVENMGPTVARHIQVRFDPPLRSDAFKEIENLPLFRDGVAALPPGRRLSYICGVGHELFGEGLPLRYRVIVNADGPFGPLDPLEYEIDLSDLKEHEARSGGSIAHVVGELKEINNTLRRMPGRIRPPGIMPPR